MIVFQQMKNIFLNSDMCFSVSKAIILEPIFWVRAHNMS